MIRSRQVMTRRTVLAGIGGSLAAYGISGTATGQTQTVTITLDSVGTRAWEVSAVDGADDVATTDTDNPTLTLTVGTRYQFSNEQWNFHPLAFRDAEDDPLLSQSADGRFEDREVVNWVDENDTVQFTLTDDLAAAMDTYICTAHPSMEGAVETVADESDMSTTDTTTNTTDTETNTTTNTTETETNTTENTTMESASTNTTANGASSMTDESASDTNTSTSDSAMPGFGIGSVLAALTGASYLLTRHRSDSEEME